MDNERIDEFLAHHGILGMKWGVSHGPPYPLSKAEHNKVTDKAKKVASSTGKTIKKAGSATVKGVKKASAATASAIKDAKQKSEIRKAEKENERKILEAKKEEERKIKEAEEREKEIRELTPKTFSENRTKYTDAEVFRIANRLRLEQQIAELDKTSNDTNNPNKNKMSKGEKFVTNTLKKVATDTIKDIATASTTTIVEKALGMNTGSTGQMIQQEFSKIRRSSRANTNSQNTIKGKTIKRLN